MTKQARVARKGDMALVVGLYATNDPLRRLVNGEIVHVLSDPYEAYGLFGGTMLKNDCTSSIGQQAIRTSALIPLDPPPESRRLFESEPIEQTDSAGA